MIDDSGGGDLEIEKLNAFADTLILSSPFNLGHQRAIVGGLRWILPQTSPQDMIVTLDADGEDQPTDIPRLLEAVLSETWRGGPIALALRTHRRETTTFKLLYFCFQVLFRFLTGTIIRMGNFAAMRSESITRLIGHPYFDLVYSSTLISLQPPLRLVPCRKGLRYFGTSRMSKVNLINHGLRMLVPFGERIAVRLMKLMAICFSLGLIGATAKIFLSLKTLGVTRAFVSASPFAAQSGGALVLGAVVFSLFSAFKFWQGYFFRQFQLEPRLSPALAKSPVHLG